MTMGIQKELRNPMPGKKHNRVNVPSNSEWLPFPFSIFTKFSIITNIYFLK